jgi:hypothetical protein
MLSGILRLVPDLASHLWLLAVLLVGLRLWSVLVAGVRRFTGR